VNAHYIIQRKGAFWLLSREDNGRDLAFFPSKQQAVQRAEVLANESMPSQLDIYHELARLETRHYPKLPRKIEPVTSVQEHAL
jgi:hypothetical protein